MITDSAIQENKFLPRNDEIVPLVETMLQLQKEKQQTTLPDKPDQLNTRIEYTDERINKLVFELH